MIEEIRTGDFVFTKEDSIKLCTHWQDLEWGKPDRFTRDNIESLIEELCLAFGHSVEEVRATWWRNRCPWRAGVNTRESCFLTHKDAVEYLISRARDNSESESFREYLREALSKDPAGFRWVAASGAKYWIRHRDEALDR